MLRRTRRPKKVYQKKFTKKSLPKKAPATLSATRYFAMKSQSLLYPVDSSQSFMFARRIL